MNKTSGTNWELDRKHINLRVQLGIGEFGPIYDAEVQLGVNLMSRAAIKVTTMYMFVLLGCTYFFCC